MKAPINDAGELFEFLPCAAFWLAGTGGEALANPAARRLLQAIFDPVAEWSGAEIQAWLQRWLHKELESFSHFQESGYEFSKELVTARRILNFGVQFQRYGAGEGSATLILLTDRTVEIRLDEALRRAYQDREASVATRTSELEEANETLRHYASQCEAAAHELKKLSCALEHTADHVIITDAEGVIEYVNPAFERLTGYTLAEAAGRTPRLLKSGKMEPKFFEGLWTTLQRGEVFRAVFTNRKKSGEIYFEEKTITPVKNGLGRTTHFISIGRDVTARRQAEAEREQLVADLQTALAHLKVLRGILPTCSHCKRIRDAGNRWVKMEDYLREHSEVRFTHGICPECTQEHFSEYLTKEPEQLSGSEP